MADHTTEMDVAELLTAVRAAVRAQTPASADDQTLALRAALDQVELTRVVSAHWPITGQTPLQKLLGLAQKLSRRLLRWYINPIVEQQNAYNAAVAQTLRELAEAYADLDRRAPADDRTPTTGEYGQTTAQTAVPSVVTFAQQPPTTADLQALVAARGAAAPPPALPDIALRASVPQRAIRRAVSAHWPLPAATSAERAAALAHQIQRQLLRFYINPIVEQQNAANAALDAALNCAIALDAEQRARDAARRAARR